MALLASTALAFGGMVVAAGNAGATPVRPGGGSGVPDSEPVTVTLTLTGAEEHALDGYAAAVSTPGNAAYRQHLSRTQLQERFGAPPSRVARVSSWARRAGFTVQGMDATGTRLTVTGTARVARAAFDVGLTRTSKAGVPVRVATTNPRKPAAIAADLQAVTGLTQHVAKPQVMRQATQLPRRSRIGAAARDGEFCSTFWAEWNKGSVPQKYPAGKQSNPVCGYNGPQLRALYGLGAGDRGAGQTVVIVGAFNSPTALADANATFARNGVPPLPASRYITKIYQPSGGSNGCDVAGFNAEQALDIQAAHTIAPEATIVYAAAPDCTQLEETVARVLADASIDTTIISNSWLILGPEPADTEYLTATNRMLARATVLGVGTYFASGDFGDNSGLPGQSGPSVSFPASSPWTTAVGGTSAGIGADNQLVFQTGWESAGNRLAGGDWQRLEPPFLFGAGGGTSQRFTKPSWQANLPGQKRLSPDIAALGDPYTGFLVGFTVNGQFQTTPLGGTSLATPILAGLVAVAQARVGGDTTVGLLTPVLYSKAAAGRSVVTDVKHVGAGIWTPVISAELPRGDYLIDIDAGVQTLKTVPGYDPVTGLGVPGPAFLTEIVS